MERARRRVQDVAEEDTSGRRGCILTGAVLGIVFGAIFTFFALPPLLNYFFGEVTVGAGETFHGGHQDVRVDSVTAGPDGTPDDPAEQAIFVHLIISVDRTWDSKPPDWDLEFDDGSTVGARAGLPTPEGSFRTEPGKERTLVLRFHPRAGSSAKPRALILHVPQARFTLPPVR